MDIIGLEIGEHVVSSCLAAGIARKHSDVKLLWVSADEARGLEDP